MIVPFFRPSISAKTIQDVSKTIKSGWLTTGPNVKDFEQKFAEYVNAKYALALNSGTAALHLALDAIGLKRGDEVIVPTLTFAATAEVVEYFDAKPVLCDIRSDTKNIDENRIEGLINKNTKAVIPVHYAGHPCEMNKILKIAKKYKIKVIEDAAHCTPAYYKNKPIGSIGHITCFSFYANKCITTGEGGMVVTNNKNYIERMRIMSLHGLSKDAWNRYSCRGNWYYQIVDRGFKYNMTDVAAAIGLNQLRDADKLWQKRKTAAQKYGFLLKDIENIVLPKQDENVKSAWYIYPIWVDYSKINRNKLIDDLLKMGIKTSVHFIPLHMHKFYKNKYKYKAKDFINAYNYYKGCITLPLFPDITEKEQKYVHNCMKKTIPNNKK